MSVDEYRIIFIGDELIAGVRDARAMGWTGRVLARTESPIPIIGMPLAMPGEDSHGLVSRWQSEVLPRLGDNADNRLVIGLGSHDLDSGTSMARARLNVANLLDQATRHRLNPLVVGPPPRPDQPARAQADLTAAYRDVTDRREIPFVDTYTPLATHDQWHQEMSSGTYAPGQAGYGVLAWLVLHQGWHHWLGLPS